ncbi:MAG: hypothetical protein ACR2JY_13555 [Chloroflexota bacterium]
MSEAGRAMAQVELEAVVGEALRTWQQEHPRATLDEIVATVDTALLPVRTAYIGELAAAEEAAVMAEQRCPECGKGMQQRGRHLREVLVPGQAPALRLERTETVCPSCGRSLFPPR